jgi:ATP-binding cassette subfamily F protein uup
LAERLAENRASSAQSADIIQHAEKKGNSAPHKNDYSQRLSFKEKFELEQLEKDLEKLEEQKTRLTAELYQTQEHADLQRLGDELKDVTDSLETAENRWLELSERTS